MNYGGRRVFSLRLTPLCMLALVVAVAAVTAGGASATTAPGYRFALPVVITDAGVRLVPLKSKSGKLLSHYIKNDGRSAEFPRGVLIQFVFTNKGSAPSLPAIRIKDASDANPYQKTKQVYTANHVVKPGGRATLYGNFYYRGSFEIQNLVNKKPHGATVRFAIY
jgi:hypothetical protein